MAEKKTGLGRNLSALLGQSNNALTQEEPQSTSLKLSVDSLQPGKYQPRLAIEEESLQELADSIKQQGVLQPLIVRKVSQTSYEIIAGERRWRASMLAGLKEVPVILKQVDDETAMAVALIENLQREDLNAIDQARAMQRLTTEFSLTHQQVADLLCKSRASVSNFLRLLALSPSVQKLLEYGDIDMGHARALLSLDELAQTQAAQIIVAKNLSVRETEKLVERMRTETKPNEHSIVKSHHPHYQQRLENLSTLLRAEVKLKHSTSGRGSLIIHYKNNSELNNIMEQLIQAKEEAISHE
jgi:ParB family chromosome partitioning protein